MTQFSLRDRITESMSLRISCRLQNSRNTWTYIMTKQASPGTSYHSSNASCPTRCVPPFEKLNPRNIDHCFEIYGFDFMIDCSLRAWLIEVNTNPCLALCNATLSRLIPNMLAGAFQLTLDRVFPQGLSRSTLTSLSSSTSPSEACCPAGHVLTDYLTPVPGYCCDACGRKVPAKTHLWGCRKCDYYHCSECCTNVPLHENELEKGWERIYNSADDAITPSCTGLRSSSNGKKSLGHVRWLPEELRQRAP